MVADVDDARGNQALTQCVDRRVGYLGEQLVEVVEEGTVLLGQAGQRGIDAHRGQRHAALFGHGADHFVHVVPVVAQLGHAHREGHVGIGGRLGSLRSLEVGNLDLLFLDPVAVGLFLGVAGADLVVPDDTVGGGVDLQHLARAQAAGGKDVLRLDLDGAHLGGEQEAIVARYVVTGGTQAVAVERSAEGSAVGVCDGGRAVPWLHQHGLVLVVGAAARRQVVVVVPRLGEQHGNRARHVAAVHHQELQHVVEHGGVGAFFVDDGQDLLQVFAQNRRVQVGFAGADPVHVALQRVDLAVMDDVAVRMRALPRRGGVRGIAGVHQRDGRLHRSIGKVDVEAAHLRGNQHALVHDGAGAERAHVEDVAIERMLGVGGLFHHAAAYVQAALKCIAALDVFGAADESLQDGGHAGARRRAQVVGIDGHLAPEKQGQAGLRAAFLEDALGNLYASLVLGEEEHGHAIIALVRQKMAAFLRFLAEEMMGDLEQDTGTVARVVLQALTAAMLQIHKDRQGIVDHLVRADALQMGQRANAARVMLELRTIQPALRGHLP